MAPGQNAFCVKICSKIIVSQFCIILLTHGGGAPNANVNMEYGLMLGFNKYVIPFQRAEQELPFNVAGLDTIKYTNQNFETRATSAIDTAIEATKPGPEARVDVDQRVQTFILVKETQFASIDSEGDKVIFGLGAPLGFNLLIDF